MMNGGHTKAYVKFCCCFGILFEIVAKFRQLENQILRFFLAVEIVADVVISLETMSLIYGMQENQVGHKNRYSK